MKNAALALAFVALSVAARAQVNNIDYTTLSQKQRMDIGTLEEVGMCHHAVRAAQAYAGKWDPLTEYAINSEGGNFPPPERCVNTITPWIVAYTGAPLIKDDATKEQYEALFMKVAGIGVQDMVKDRTFLINAGNAVAKLRSGNK